MSRSRRPRISKRRYCSCWYCSHKARALKHKAKKNGLRPEKYA